MKPAIDGTAHEECGAKTRSGGTCKKNPGWGTDHVGYGNCKLHGGASPNGRKHAQTEHAKDAVATYGLPREVDPHTALLEELHRTAGIVAWLGIQVAALDTDHVTHLIVGRLEVIDERTNEWVKLFQAERKHLTLIAKTCVDVGIEERRIHLEEQQGAMLARVIDGILTDLGVRNHPEAPRVVRRHLTLVQPA